MATSGYYIWLSSTNRRNWKSQWGFESKYCLIYNVLPSVLWCCWLGDRKGIRPVKTEWWGTGVVNWLERGANLHMALRMPLPPTVSCFSKIQIGFSFLVPAHLGSPGQMAVKRVCVIIVVLPTSEAGKEAHSLRQYILYVYVLIFISFFWAHGLTECRKLGMCEGDSAEAKISEVVVSSTCMWVGHPGA